MPTWESAATNPEIQSALLLTISALRCPESGAFLVERIRAGGSDEIEALRQLTSWSHFDARKYLLEAAQSPGLDEGTQTALFRSASQLLFPVIRASASHKKAYAEELLAAAPEGPIRELVQNSIMDAGLLQP